MRISKIVVSVYAKGLSTNNFRHAERILFVKQTLPPPPLVHISLPIGTNGEPLAAIGKFPSAIGKLMIGKTLAINGEEITNAMIGNDELANY